MESVWDQTSVYAPRDTKDVCVMKVGYDARNHCPSYVSNFFPITCVLPHHLPRGFSICCLSNVSYWLQMWMSAVSWRDRVPSAAWIHTVAIAVTASLDTHSVQMDTPAAVSNFLFKHTHLKWTDGRLEPKWRKSVKRCQIGSLLKDICHPSTIMDA